MPELDGLELVGAVRSRFPLVPVILMTAYGSEEIAVRALRRGAASYVPKSRLALELLDTVDSVLHMSRADRFHDRLAECLIGGHSKFESADRRLADLSARGSLPAACRPDEILR